MEKGYKPDDILEKALIPAMANVGNKFSRKEIEENPNAVIGLSALLTTTMENMRKTAVEIKANNKDSKIMIGGAPVTQDY